MGIEEAKRRIAHWSEGQLDLSRLALSAIPVELWELTDLTELDLSWNNLADIPNLIDSLKDLIRLELVGNTLHSIPDSVGNLTKLRWLMCGGNQIDQIPRSITRLTNLSKLDLNNNKLAQLPDYFGDLGTLTHLNLSQNLLQTMPDSFCGLTQLVDLQLQDNELVQIPAGIALLPELKKLCLERNRISELPTVFNGLSSVQFKPQQSATLQEWSKSGQRKFIPSRPPLEAKFFPEPSTVFTDPEKAQQYFFPLLTVDLNEIDSDLSGPIHFVLPVEAAIEGVGYGTEEFHTYHCTDDWVGFDLTDGLYQFEADYRFFQRGQLLGGYDAAIEANDVAASESASSYKSLVEQFDVRIGGMPTGGHNWMDCSRIPTETALELEDPPGTDDPENGYYRRPEYPLTQDGKRRFTYIGYLNYNHIGIFLYFDLETKKVASTFDYS